ncbi:NADP-dependent 3-hydroxy acid dehydrogenase YdfG [Arthrobacter sp. SLBN-100]|uniref:SDR family oxidoreductase n=1 Tax=Arthrobacter sp. SLBN-100 TaxID=2768450 RepID=UPI001175683B|nr:SDR family oxidoreductase [Arthrobacter sp. SLBN-100]TQJ68141.1 NADP-dependent 3-hydroxy acid dehydrogenase YdfG [Arthrobacter sp. SLBN-100]
MDEQNGAAVPGQSRPIAVITGASSGIGLAIAEELSVTHKLVLIGRAGHKLEDIANRFEQAESIVLDVTGDIDATALAMSERGVDVLVHSAGMSLRGKADSVTRPEWRESFELNLFAVAELTRLLLPALRRSSGTVVFLNSGAGLFTSQKNSIYCATKHALRAYADVLREEERVNGVRVTSIHPGYVDTAMARSIASFEGAEHHPETYLRPSSVAAAVRLAVNATEEAMIESLSIRPRLPVKM